MKNVQIRVALVVFFILIVDGISELNAAKEAFENRQKRSAAKILPGMTANSSSMTINSFQS